MHPILEQFLDKWVWPTMPGAPGAEFRLRLTREKCVKGWEISLQRTLAEIEEGLGRQDEAWKKERALRGYAAEGVHMSIKQMSGQLLSVDIADQERYIDLQRMRARQIINASPPSGRWTVCGARSRYFSGTRCTHRSGGTSRCPSLDIRLYWRAISTSVRNGSDPSAVYLVLHQCARCRAVLQTLGATGAFQLLHFV